MTVQLRDYRIVAGRLDDFVRAWRDTVVPLRRSFGYEIVGAWSIPDEDRFVWVLRYEGPLAWEDADERYYASKERASLAPDPASWVEASSVTLADEVL